MSADVPQYSATSTLPVIALHSSVSNSSTKVYKDPMLCPTAMETISEMSQLMFSVYFRHGFTSTLKNSQHS